MTLRGLLDLNLALKLGTWTRVSEVEKVKKCFNQVTTAMHLRFLAQGEFQATPYISFTIPVLLVLG